MAKKKEEPKLTVVKDEPKEEKKLNKPTPEEVVQFKADFENAMKEFTETRFPISDAGNFSANDIGFFIKDYMKKYAFWNKTQWMGMLKMDEELNKAMQNANDSTPLALDYQALEFCGYMLSNPGGTGFDMAVEFEKQADKYSRVMTTIGQQVEKARAQLKNVQYLQEKWAAGEQGFYLAELEPPKEQKPEEKVTDNVPNPPEEEQVK